MRDWLCFFLILALRALFLGEGRRGEKEGEGEPVKCSWGFLACPVGTGPGVGAGELHFNLGYV